MHTSAHDPETMQEYYVHRIGWLGAGFLAWLVAGLVAFFAPWTAGQFQLIWWPVGPVGLALVPAGMLLVAIGRSRRAWRVSLLGWSCFGFALGSGIVGLGLLVSVAIGGWPRG